VRSGYQFDFGPVILWFGGAILLMATTSSCVVRGQEATAGVDAAAAAAAVRDPNSHPEENPARILSDLPQRDALLGLAEWNHTLLGAFQLGTRLFRMAAPPATASVLLPAQARVSAVLRFSAFGPPPRVTMESIAKVLKMDQLQRQGMNVNLNSAYGSFRLQYREVFSARANTLGGGVGQASAAATYTSPRFGAGRLMDFSAAALMGTGSINQLLGTGFGSSAIGGFGPGRRSDTAPTVAIKLTF